jgi:hypothetical protein
MGNVPTLENNLVIKHGKFSGPKIYTTPHGVHCIVERNGNGIPERV